MKDFKEFLLRGNLVDTAVGIVIGLAFAAVVTAFVADLITPLLAAIGGKPNFASLSFTVNKSHFLYGAFINAVVTFLIIAAVVFFFVVKPVNAMVRRRRAETRGRRESAAVPGMPERDSDRRPSVRVLHDAVCCVTVRAFENPRPSPPLHRHRPPALAQPGANVLERCRKATPSTAQRAACRCSSATSSRSRRRTLAPP
jgi:large conductance mechanosensitive channel